MSVSAFATLPVVPVVTGIPVMPVDSSGEDVGPLAWVLVEIRKSLDGAVKSLWRQAQDAPGDCLAGMGLLQQARQQLHQAVGALQMVGCPAPALVLGAMEFTVQGFIADPLRCNDASVDKVERAGFAVTDFLQALVAGKTVDAVALFPQYRELLEGTSSSRIHPADLWSKPWHWVDVPMSGGQDALAYDPAVRSRLDRDVLKVLTSSDGAAARRMHDLSLGLAQGASGRNERSFWILTAGFFEALALSLIPYDVYVKRAASRVLSQYATLARGEPEVSGALAHDLLFLCSRALPGADAQAETLLAVRAAWNLPAQLPVDYTTIRFGRYSPLVLAQARQRIDVAKETWSALAAGDVSRIHQAVDTFSQLGESLQKLYPPSLLMAQALGMAVEASLRSGQAPGTELAMEVATSMLYLEAALEDLDPLDQQLTVRTAQLAARIERASNGGHSEPLESWMEELYRRIVDRRTMGTVVDELRIHLAELEKSLDQYFRRPAEHRLLQTVPSQLLQLRSVFSVLGLDHAARTVSGMRTTVDHLLAGATPAGVAREFDSLGNNLGALGFLIDMLGYQPDLARRLFVFDQLTGQLKPLMGRQVEAGEPDTHPNPASPTTAEPPASVHPVLSGDAADAALTARLAALASPDEALSPIEEFSRATVSWTAKIAGPTFSEISPGTEVTELGEDDLNDIFLNEAREVLLDAITAVAALKDNAGDTARQTVLRRAFHTLKGSSRMVGLAEFGNAAWSFEQLLNVWLAEQRSVTPELLAVLDQGLLDMGRWVRDIAAGEAQVWQAQPLQEPADALRNSESLPALRRPARDDTQAAVVVPGLSESIEPAGFFDLHGFPDLPDPGFAPTTPGSAFDIGIAPEPAGPALPDASKTAGTLVPGPDFNFDFDVTRLGSLDGLDDMGEFGLPPVSDAVARQEFDPTVPALLDEFAEVRPPEEPTLPTARVPDFNFSGVDDTVKVIGPLRIGIALYNVYLSEADEWSGRLVAELGEWAAEPDRLVPDSTVVLAHSLAGSSATVGFEGLSGMARLLESALQHLCTLGRGSVGHGAVLVAAADELRHLLHQFAAGFLKNPEPSTLEALRDIATATLPAATPVESLEEVAVFSPPMHALVAPSGAGQVRLDDDGDTLDLHDAVDADLFPIFEEEAAELLPQLGTALRAWTQHPGDPIPRASTLRTLHTLKGSARLAGAMRLGERAHGMESEIELIGTQSITRAAVDMLLVRFDALQAAFDGLRADDAAMQLAIGQQAVEATVTAPRPDEPEAARSFSPEAGASPSDAATRHVALPSPSMLTSLRPVSDQAVRIRTHLLDRLVAQAGEVIVTRTRLEVNLGLLRSSLKDLTGNLERLRQQLRDVELQAETQMQSRLAQTKDAQQGFDPLEFDRFTRVQELTRMMAESVDDVATVQRTLHRTVQATEDDLTAQARQTRELQRGLLRTRMVEFEGLSERLYRVVRQASKDTGRQVRLDITGGSIEMDRGVLDRMTPAFEHLLRNSVAHGIEDAAVRLQAGKDAAGLITVALHHEGNDVSVSFQDDGAGLDYRRIAERARALGLLGVDQPMTPGEAADLIFRPGFSTALQVSELVGRGIGMDVVRVQVDALGGRIETRSTPGQGTTFRLVLPLTTAVTHVVMLRAGALSIGVPSNLVELVQRASAADLAAAYARQSYSFAGEELPFFWAGALLDASPRSEQPVSVRANTIVVVRSAAQRIAMHVDEVLGNQEVVVKNLGPQLARLPGMAGITVLASGAVALIYNPVALATVHGERARRLQGMGMAGDASATPSMDAVLPLHNQVAPRTPLILVVDDSITVRRITQRLLLREGYRVALAADGLQALECLQQERPAVVLSDIEMPRMDGFDLARNIRADAALDGLPIIMITSRIAEKHREHARKLGVDHYLGKPYSEDELLTLVRSYTSQALLSGTDQATP